MGLGGAGVPLWAREPRTAALTRKLKRPPDNLDGWTCLGSDEKNSNKMYNFHETSGNLTLDIQRY